MSDQLWGLVFVVVVAVVLIVIIGQIMGMRGEHLTNKAEVARDEAYKTLAEQAVAAQQAALDEQQKIAGELAKVQSRLSAIEKLLSEVG
jgi:predicted Holliday junction resolvase-like endonuclease